MLASPCGEQTVAASPARFWPFAPGRKPVYTLGQQKIRHLAVLERYQVANLQTATTSLAAATIVSTLRNAIKLTATWTTIGLGGGRFLLLLYPSTNLM